MYSLRKLSGLYLKHINDFLDKCTMEDARTMIILGILLVTAGIFDIFHIFTIKSF